MADIKRLSTDQLLTNAKALLADAKTEVANIETEIRKAENEIQTATSVGDRQIANLEQQAKDAQALDEFDSVRAYLADVARARDQQAERIGQLESRLGDLRSKQIEATAERTAVEAKVDELKEQAAEEAQKHEVSEEQLKRASDLEKRLSRLEDERSDLVQQIEQYAPLVEAQREATTASGSAELSEAYASQADAYKKEWQRWLVCLGIAVVAAMVGGVAVILLTHPAGDASNSEIASRIAIEILVLGLLVYAVRVTAHQFRVHRHLETVSRSKAAALMTFNRLVAGPGEAEVRTAVAVALAQAVFDSNGTGFIDSAQDGVTIVERIAAPVARRLGD